MRFIRNIFPFIGLLLFAELLSAQGVFYRIEKQGEQPSYLFGVLSTQNADTYNLSDSVYAVLNVVDAVATQLVVDSTAKRHLRQMTELSKTSLLDLYNNEKYGLIERQMLYKKGDFLQPYQEQWPLYIRHLLEQAQVKSNGGQRSVEGFFTTVAQEQGKEILNYFTPLEQVQVWEEIPLQLQADMLFSYVEELHYNPQSIREMLRFYLQGNVNGLANYVSQKEHFQYYEAVKHEQVRHIAGKIAPLSSGRSVFFMVPADNLGGEDNLIDALKTQGYTLTAINPGFLIPEDSPQQEYAEPGDSLVFFPFDTQYDEAYFDRVVPTWKDVIVHRGAFTVKMPEIPAVAIDKVPANDRMLTVNVYKYDDKAVNTFYMVSYNDYPEDFEPLYKRDFFRDVVSSVVRRMNGTLLIERDISNTGYQGREIEIKLEENYTIRGRFYLVGNRLYQVLLGGAEQRAYEPENDAFLKSFRLINQENLHWYTLNLGTIEADLPMQPEYSTTTVADSLVSYSFSATQPVTGLNFLISYSILPEEVKNKEKASFYNNLAFTAANETKGIFIRDETTGEDLPWKYLELGGQNDQVYRIIFFTHDQKLYQLMVHGSSDAAYSGYADHFIRSFATGRHEY